MTRYLLDTGVVIRHLRGQPAVVAWLRCLAVQGRLGIASVTRSEIHAGLHPLEAEPTQKLLNRLVTYHLSPTIADLAGDYIREYQAKRINLSPHSAIIAATAITCQLTVVTLKLNDFPMPGITLCPLPARWED
ncbi:MAG: PIN domain-containing protein [Anaerolineae bacterium]